MNCTITNKVFKGTLLALLLNLAGTNVANVAMANGQSQSSQSGFPGRRVGGGTRGDCMSQTRSLVALIPETHLSITTAAHPTLFFYVPPEPKPQRGEAALKVHDPSIEFVLRDDHDALVNETTQVLEGSDIVGFNLLPTPNFPSLALNRNYHWYLSIICNQLDRAEDVVVEGWIRRVELPTALSQQLETSTQLESVKLFQQAGIWHEALSMLLDLRQARPQDADVLAEWQQLLQSTGLERLLLEAQATQTGVE